jgi:UDP-N-acetylglucosamine 4,6-dehydratase
MFNDKVILITGGTGSFGKKCTEIILKRYKPKKLIVFSRDELKQFEMAQIYLRVLLEPMFPLTDLIL